MASLKTELERIEEVEAHWRDFRHEADEILRNAYSEKEASQMNSLLEGFKIGYVRAKVNCVLANDKVKSFLEKVSKSNYEANPWTVVPGEFSKEASELLKEML